MPVDLDQLGEVGAASREHLPVGFSATALRIEGPGVSANPSIVSGPAPFMTALDSQNEHTPDPGTCRRAARHLATGRRARHPIGRFAEKYSLNR